ncbi:MAG: hypothetical protein ACREDR_15305 [Blastocatellia bacterium]
MHTQGAAYNELVCVVEPISAFLTPLNADTIWGMLACACRWIHGEDSLRLLLDPNRQGFPPLLVSDALPSDKLPRPRFPVTATDVKQALLACGFDEGADDYLERLAVAKTWIGQDLIDRDSVFELLIGSATHVDLLRRYLPGGLANRRQGRSLAAFEISRSRRHNIIDRERGGAKREDGLYTHHESFLLGTRHIYVRTTLDPAWLRPLIEVVGDSGFGKRSSTGMGQFRVLDLRPLKPHEQFPRVADSDSFMTLSSSYVPAPDDQVRRSYYAVHLKRGKLGSGITTNAPGGFLKYPVAMFRAGSIFQVDSPSRPWFGRLLDEIHGERPEIRQFAFAYPIPGRFFS